MTVSKMTQLSGSDTSSRADWLVPCGEAPGGSDCWCETKAMADVWKIMTDDTSRWAGHRTRGAIVSCSGGVIGKATGRRARS
jgi:hypothetical protein